MTPKPNHPSQQSLVPLARSLIGRKTAWFGTGKWHRAGGRLRGWWATGRVLVLATLVIPRISLEATEPPADAPDASAEFRLIEQRNIFSPSRRSASAPPPASMERKPVRVDSFALVGTMSYAKGQFAFFEGSSSEYRKVLSKGEQIGGFVIREIHPDHILLEKEGRAIELSVNSQLTREDEGEWKSAPRSSFASSGRSGRESSRARSSSSGSRSREPASSSPSEQASESSADPSSSDSSSDAEAILKRLMEQREKDLE